MGVIGIVLLVILVVSAILLVLVVLVQDEQGEGIGGIFGGGSNTAFGSRSGNVLTRFTALLAAIFLVCCFGLAWINRTPTAGNVVSKARQEALSTADQQKWYLPTTPTPAATAGSGASSTAAGGTGTTSSTSSGSTTTPAGSQPSPSRQGGQ
ncbi:MAG: preprotein translocase subunit SecG [Spirochaetia bacterium]|jgi:preprotein translocase subunit SecG